MGHLSFTGINDHNRASEIFIGQVENVIAVESMPNSEHFNAVLMLVGGELIYVKETAQEVLAKLASHRGYAAWQI